MPEIPKNILSLLDLAGEAGSRPFDRLKRGKPVSRGREAVGKFTLNDLGGSKDPQALAYLQSALYLYFDCFDEAHQVAQDHEDVYGNWLHAIAHRREPDVSNSKYWYARVKAPAPVFHSIGAQAVDFALSDNILELELLGAKIAKAKTWQPEVFVDLNERFREKDPGSEVYKGLAHIQDIEWRGLLGFILDFPR